LPTKRRLAEVSVQLPAALVSSADTILIEKPKHAFAGADGNPQIGDARASGLRAYSKRFPTRRDSNKRLQRRISMNNENLTVHFKVKDFNAWRTSYNGHEKDRVSAGITNSRVFRSADDPNDVVILQDVADVSKARTWLTSSEMKSVMEKSGVLGSPNLRFAAAA